MTRTEQRELLTSFCNSVRDSMLGGSDKWPEAWDGHELRELAAKAFDWERTRLMRESGKRRKACHNQIVVNNLY